MANITSLLKNQVFVFGSNDRGLHAGGAARLALDKFGAKMGQATGLQGQSYGIVTIGWSGVVITIDDIRKQLQDLNVFALEHPELEFLLTKIGCGIAGFAEEDILSLVKSIKWVKNVILPEDWQ